MAGSGTQQDPFQVMTYEDLCKVGTGIDNWNLDSYYIQMENIQCPTGENRHNFVPIGSYGNPFTGQYDGNDKTIKNLYIDRGDTDDIGLFGCASSGVLKNISLLNVNITGRYRCGALVGYITEAGLRVDSCNSSGIIYGTFGTVGGLIGAVSSGTEEDNTIIINSHSSVTVESEGERAGGFAGQFWTGVMVDNCYATGNVTGMGFIGGFVGIMSTANAIDCYATGEVEGGENTGGFAGKLQVSSTVENCYAIGNVTGTGLTGGFAGFMSTANAIDCYAEGAVEGGESTGGFVGQLQNSSIVENCYATGDVNGGERTGGFVGNFILESTATNCHTTNTVTGTQYIGGFAGFMSTNANSINCYSEGSVNSNGNLDTGGFVGFMSNANAIDCYAEGEVTGTECTGGFVGIMSSNANAINCYAEGEVTGTQYTGGFAGQLQGSSIVENCYATGDVNGGERTGGFVGNFISESITTNCHATNTVTGMRFTGGFAGIMFTANAIDCYSKGSVNSNGNPDTGGFVGKLQISSTVENCYATGAVEGGENTGGFAGNVSSDSVVLYCFWDINTSGQIASAGGTGKTTAEMQSISTFANWNIVSIDNFNRDTPTIWFIDDGNDYPRLGWEYVPKFAIKRFKVCVDNANRPVKTSKYGVNNVWRNIKEIKSGISNAWRSVWKRAAELIRELIRTFTTKADFDTCALTDTVATEAGDVELSTGKTTGTAESPAIDLSSAGVVETSEIAWSGTTVDTGKVLSFDGVDDYVEIPDYAGLQLADNFSVKFKFKAASLSQYQKYILCKGNNDYAVIWGYGDNQIEFFAVGFTGADPRIGSGIEISDTEWHEIEYRYDGNIWSGYKDGVEVFSVNRTFSLRTAVNVFKIGSADTKNFFNGCIANVEIKKNGVTTSYYALNEGTGTTANDSTANANHGTIYGATWADGAKTTLTIQTALSTDGGATYGEWQTATSGAAIPGLTAGDDVSNTKMKWKATLSTNDVSVTPKLHDVTVKLNEGM